ncbi:MAG: low molecular weight protein-tyrosine-phosphatase [Candidatus Cyclobacteriaceae bacterium M2_1C_046]
MKVSVLFVCLGNICRSPLAKSLFMHHVKEKGLEDEIFIDSCGTSHYHLGESPDERTIANAAKNGLNISNEARQLLREDLRKFDYIVAMDRSNLKNIKLLDHGNEFSHKIFLMRDFDPKEKGTEVPDPYFGGEEGFQNVYDILNRSTKEFLNHIIKKEQLMKVEQ